MRLHPVARKEEISSLLPPLAMQLPEARSLARYVIINIMGRERLDGGEEKKGQGREDGWLDG